MARLVLWLLLLAGGLVQAAPPRPDILLLMPDQMRGDCLSALGHPVVRTPTLDGLAGQGTLFRRAYSTCPSCIPARHALLTGLFPASSGVVGFAGRPIKTPTLPGLLAKGGYHTVLAGRYMHQVPKDAPYGYQEQYLGSTHVDDDDYDRYLQQAAPESGGIRSLVGKLGLTYNGWEAKPWPLADDLHPTAWIVRAARKVLSNAPPEKPLFLTASFYSPHPPLFAPRKYYDFYCNQKLPAPAHGDWVDWNRLSPKGDRGGHRVRLEGETLRATQAGYFGLIEHLDAEIAPLLEQFKTRSHNAGRPWLVVVCSDHGELLGDNGYFRKCEPYEGSANIPFIVAGASELGFKPGRRNATPVCLEDIMPTLLELAGVDCPGNMDGMSLVPVLAGKTIAARDWLLFEHAPCYSDAQAFLAVTDGRLKYIWRPSDGSEQLFNLEQDGREEHDLVRLPEATASLKSCRERMVRLLASRPEGFSDGTRLISGRPYRPLQAR